MSVTNLSLKAFSLFREAEFAFSPGLNVLIGANATGKSHVMKLLYSILKIKAGGANHTGRDSEAPEMTDLLT